MRNYKKIFLVFILLVIVVILGFSENKVSARRPITVCPSAVYEDPELLNEICGNTDSAYYGVCCEGDGGGGVVTPVVNCSGSWSACVDGSQTFSISTPASGGGSSCDYSDGDTQSCSSGGGGGSGDASVCCDNGSSCSCNYVFCPFGADEVSVCDTGGGGGGGVIKPFDCYQVSSCADAHTIQERDFSECYPTVDTGCYCPTGIQWTFTSCGGSTPNCVQNTSRSSAVTDEAACVAGTPEITTPPTASIWAASTSVPYKGSTTTSWACTNTYNGNTSGGPDSTGELESNYEAWVYCEGPGGFADDSVVITVGSPPEEKCTPPTGTTDGRNISCSSRSSAWTGTISQTKEMGSAPACLWSSWVDDSIDCSCAAPLSRTFTVPCDRDQYGNAASSGVVTRSQDKSDYPDCSFSSDVSDSIYVSDNCVYPSPTNGVCSSSTYGCLKGSSTGQDEDAYSWTWSCTGTNGGDKVECSKEKPVIKVDGKCGSITGECSAGVSGEVSSYVSGGSTYYEWICTGLNGGNGASCLKSTVGGQCGATHYSCATGSSINNVNGTSSWTWGCSAGGIVDSCSEDKPCAPPLLESRTIQCSSINSAWKGTISESRTKGSPTACEWGSWTETANNCSCALPLSRTFTAPCDPINGKDAISGVVTRSQDKNDYPDCSFSSSVSDSVYVSDNCVYEDPVCPAPLTKTVTVPCDPINGKDAISGVVTRSQDKSDYPGCVFPDTVTPSNSTYVSDNCVYPPSTCPAPLSRTVSGLACDPKNGKILISGSVTRTQNKTPYPECVFIDPLTASNSTYVSDNCVYSDVGVGGGDDTMMSGALSATDCEIPAGSSSCDTNLIWNTTGPTGTSAITSSYPSQNTTVFTGDSDTQSVSVPYPSRDFYLYNNAKLLAQKTVTASCTSGTIWENGICKAVSYSPTATLRADPTTIITGGSSTLTWSSANSTSCVGSGFNTSNATSGSVSVNPTATKTYSIICSNATTQASATATVIVGTGTKKPIYIEE